MTPENLLSTNLDLIFIILSFLPAEALLKFKTVCRAWFQIISDPAFLQAHYTRPTPITAFFTARLGLPEDQTQCFKPLQKSVKFPSSITGILSNGFKVVAASHGLVCFRRGEVFLVGNPAISNWVLVESPVSFSGFEYHGTVVIYDPAVSFHFKLVVAMLKLYIIKNGQHFLIFHTYSSETSSWTVSSPITQHWDRDIIRFGKGIGGGTYLPCKIGGGSICWADDYGYLMGYDISSRSCWEVARPPEIVAPGSYHWTEYNNIMHYVSMSDGNVNVWRLEEDNGWVLVGEGSSEVLGQFVPQSFAYDRARGALLVGGRKNNEVFAFHPSISKLEMISEEAEGDDEFPQEGFDSPGFAHANTLAPLEGAEKGTDALQRLFPALHLNPVNP